MSTQTDSIKGGAVISIDKIVPSKTNPRKTFDQVDLVELALSIKQNGLLQPILVRPLNGDGRYEIVCGERRWRATKAADIATIRCIVNDLDDRQALEAQVVENLQRADLSPMHEAEAYHQLMSKNRSGPLPTIDELAARVGKSPRYVNSRLLLLTLPPVAQKALSDRTLSLSAALLLVKIPDSLDRLKAAKEICKGEWNTKTPMSARAAANHIERNYMTELKDAPFETNRPYAGDIKGRTGPEAKLEAMGPCTKCPRRTINSPELFGDFSKGDRCMDAACFAAKREAAWNLAKGEAEEKGMKLLTPKEAEHVFDYGAHVSDRSGYVSLDSSCYEDPKIRKFSALLKGKGVMPQVTIGRAETGALVRLVKKSEALEAIKKAGIKLDVRSSSSEQRDNSAARKKRKVMDETVSRAMAIIVEKAESWKDEEANTRMLFKLVLDRVGFDQVRLVMKRRNLPKVTSTKKNALEILAETLTHAQLRGLMVEVTASFFPWSPWSGLGESFVELSKFVGVDLKKIEAEVRKELDAKKVKDKKPSK